MKKLNELIEKYNRPGPRYTSYPPVPFWSKTPQKEEWFSHVKHHSHDGIDLYVHIPFCEKLCWYCGCNRTITKDHSVEKHFINLLLKEWEMYQREFGALQVNSLHLGGGTPTFLSPDNLKYLIESLTNLTSSQFVGSIEVDPRTCTQGHLEVLKELDFKRISLGIQDFDPKVQNAINRIQPVNLVEELVKKIRDFKFESINFDLIYGLPHQRVSSISETIRIVNALSPDLIAFYGFAHLPHKIANQKLISKNTLPTAAQRQELYQLGKKLFLMAGLEDIGMDHFAKPDNYLYQAKVNKRLHRNFMGYTDKKSNVLIGLGPSSISDSGMSFIQNHKDLKAYEQAILNNNLPISLGHTQTTIDLVTQKLILGIMCEDSTTLTPNLPYMNEIEEELKSFVDDGLISLQSNKIELTDLGKVFMRNIAMSFDYHLRDQIMSTRFSQTV